MDVSWDGQNSSIFISGASMRRREGDANAPNPPSPGWNGYAIDYSNGAIAFPPTSDYDRQYLITYSYYDAGGKTTTVVDQIIDVQAQQPPAPNQRLYPIWQPINPIGPMIPSGEVVSRKFIDVKSAAPWSDSNDPNYAARHNDPYTFYIQSSRTPAFDAADKKTFLGANIGVIVFNPAGHNSKEYPITGSENLTARIDYDVLDWHIIHDDRPMPANAPYSVSLSLMDIKQNGLDGKTPDIENDQTQYNGIFYGIQTTDPAQNPDMYVCYAVTGVVVNPANYLVNYRAGTVTFSPAFGAANQSSSFRFYYKARGDWALQMQKACSTYRERGDANLGYSEYYLPPGTTMMWFAATEANKTIQIQDVWLTENGGANIHLSNITLRIYPPVAGAAFPAGTLAHADITDVDKAAAGWDWSQTGMAAKAVTGLSFKTRVIWNNGATMNQTPNGNVLYTRWRKIDLDTMLTRTLQ